MHSRRALLGSMGVLSLGGGALWAVRAPPVTVVEPPADSWPQNRRDAANTARSDWKVPAEPEIEWRRNVLGAASRTSVVAGVKRVYVGGDGVAALDRKDGQQQWSSDHPGGVLALDNSGSEVPTLYAAPRDYTYWGVDEELWLRAFDAVEGTELWRLPLPSPVYDLVVTEAGVIIGCHGIIIAVNPNGIRRWQTEPPGAGAVHPMIHDGTLYAGLPGYVSRYCRRRLLDAVLRSPPRREWNGINTSGAAPPLVTMNRLVMGGKRKNLEADDPVIHAFSLDTGALDWGWGRGGGDRDHPWLAKITLTPVRIGDVGLTYTDVQFDTNENASANGTIAGINLRDGSEAFERVVDTTFRTVAAGMDSVVFAGASGQVRAYQSDGSEYWRVQIPGSEADVSDLAVVEGRVFAALEDGRVVALE